MDTSTVALTVTTKPLARFTIFANLPAEIRDVIWEAYALSSPRNIDIWSDFVCCEQESDNTTFYCQKYSSELASQFLAVPSVLQVCRECRAVGLRFYTLEYTTKMLGHTFHPTMYINYTTDTLIPWGHWKMISFNHFLARAREGRLVRLAVDISGSFWTDNMNMHLRVHNWPGNGTNQVILYRGEIGGMWKGSQHVSKFRSKYKYGPKVLELEDLEGATSQELRGVEKYLNGCLDAIAKPVAERPAILQKAQRLMECQATMSKEFKRPEIYIKKLMANPPLYEPSKAVYSTPTASYHYYNPLKLP